MRGCGDIGAVVPLSKKTDAEVFTPPEIVKFMVDAAEDNRSDSCRIEIACGEAPFVTTRYNGESGEDIPVNDRVGILDRKLRAIPANVDKFTWAKKALQSVYGYEIQGDSLLIARANVLLTFAESVGAMSAEELADITEIVAKNFFYGRQRNEIRFSDEQPAVSRRLSAVFYGAQLLSTRTFVRAFGQDFRASGKNYAEKCRSR